MNSQSLIIQKKVAFYKQANIKIKEEKNKTVWPTLGQTVLFFCISTTIPWNRFT